MDKSAQIQAEIKEGMCDRLDAIEDKIRGVQSQIEALLNDKNELEGRYKLIADYLMEDREMKEGICAACGQETMLKRDKCEACTKEADRRYRNEYQQQYKKIHIGTDTKVMVKPKRSIEEFEKDAREKGLTYGQLQAMQTLEEQRR